MLVNTHLVDTSISGVRYMLTMFLVTLSVGSSGPKSGAIAAEIAVAGQPQRLDDARLVEGEFDRHVVVAAVMVGDEAAGALVGPFHRPAERPSRACRMQTYSG